MTQPRIEAGQVWERKHQPEDEVRYKVLDPPPNEFGYVRVEIEYKGGTRWRSLRARTLRRDYRLVEEKAR